MAIRFSTGTFAVTTARKWMFVIVSGNDGGGSPDRSAHIAGANQPGTINSDGVFRVIPCLGTRQALKMVGRATQETFRREIRPEEEIELSHLYDSSILAQLPLSRYGREGV